MHSRRTEEGVVTMIEDFEIRGGGDFGDFRLEAPDRALPPPRRRNGRVACPSGPNRRQYECGFA